MIYAKSYLYLLKLKSWHRLLLSILLIGGFFLFWLFLGYLPLLNELQQVRNDMQQRKQDIQACQIAQKSCQKLEGDASALQQEFDLDCKHPGSALQQHMAELVQAVEDAQLHMLHIKKDAQKDKGWYQTAYIDLAFKGSLERILYFFSHLADHVAFVQCEQVTLQYEHADFYSAGLMLKFFMPIKA